MGLLSGLIGGFAEGGLNIANNAIKAEQRKTEQEYESELLLKRQEAVLALTDRYRQAEEQRQLAAKNAPLERFGKLAQEKAGEDLPNNPAPVTQLNGLINRDAITGPDGKPLNGGTSGFSGDIGALRSQIQNSTTMSDEDKKGALAQLDAQAGQSNQINTAMASPTRRRTSDEAVTAALEHAKVNDPVAYAAYQTSVGKSDREERRLDQSQQKIDSNDEFNRKRLESMDSWNKMKDQWHMDAAKRQEGTALTKAEKDELQSQRLAATSLMTSTEREIERYSVLQNNAMSEADKAMYSSRIQSLSGDLARYRKGLEGMAGSAVPAPAPSAKTGWDSGTGEVFKNGVVIGNAKTEQEARALSQGDKPKPPAPAKAEAIPTGGTSGSHAKQETPYTPKSRESILAEIKNKKERLTLKGTDPAILLQLQQDIRDLQAKLSGSSFSGLISTGR